MAELTTIARPYAQAAFELAFKAGSLDKWSDMLGVLAQVAGDSRVRSLLHDPKVSEQQRVDFFLSVAGDGLDEQGGNLVRVLAHYDRLAVLPQIAEIFEKLKADAENAVDVSFTSVTEVDEAYKGQLAQALKTKLGRDVRLHFDTDASLLGGAVIRAGDMVIDGSVKARLEKLAGALAG